jgi:protein-tyrosine-phosphatase/DNA-binding transcriptional ArsR family regulator
LIYYCIVTTFTVSAAWRLRVIADPHRWRLLVELARSDRRVSELTRLVGDPQNLVSYHLRELRDAGLVACRRSAFDGRDSYYRIDLARCGELLTAAAASLHLGLEPRVSPLPPRRRGRRPRVLFLCTGNSARSQIAEALLTHLSTHTVEARSAGSHPKVVHPNAVRVLAERGIDISRNTTKHFGRFSRTHFDYVVTLCDMVREVCPEFSGEPETIHWSIGDPAIEGETDESSYPAFVRTATELELRVGHLIARLSTDEGGSARAG